ncbi:MAG: OmpA family protein [Pseudomonadales bacterium]|nr:flagellar motor protein MotD [Pseudomonadales bacterium]
MKPRRDYLEDEDNHERWLISYSDFITLLFGFFVVMYAISSVNEGKYRILSSTLDQAFHKESRALEPIQVGDPLLAASPHIVDIPEQTGYRDEEEGNTHVAPSKQDVADRLAGFTADDGVVVQEDNDWLEISLDANLMFDAGSAGLAPAARALLARTASYLKDFDNPVTVEGYTDNVPVHSARYPSNWALSAARAAIVADFLAAAGVDRKRLAAVGYGENHALQTNATPAGRASNRRVVIVVARQGNQPRNLNAGGASAFAFVRQGEPAGLDESIRQIRTESGGLLFTSDSPEGG